MAELTPKDTVRILGECVEALSEISRDPAVYGDAAAALALGTLCFYADPAKVVGRDGKNLPDGGFVVFAVLGHLDANRARQLAKGGDLFRNATQSVKPFLSRAQHLLVKAGQTFPVQTVLERARARVEQAAAQVVGISVPELDPAPYKTLVGVMRPNAMGEVELDAGIPDEPPWQPPVNKSGASLRAKSSAGMPAPPALVGEQFVVAEKDDALSTDERTIFRGYRADRKTVISLQEFKSAYMLRDEYQAEFEEWVTRLQQIRDPHAVSVVGSYRTAGRIYLVYEAMDGQTLAQLLTRGPLEEADVYATLESIALGLKAYHAAGLIHRGLRPDRVLIDRDGNVRVFDSPPPRPPRPAGEEETLREKGLKGEVRYMSPELCLGQDGQTSAADVYSLGLIVCEMLLGEQNLQRIAGESVRFWLNWHVDLYKKAIPLTEIDAEISPELSELVVKMLEKRTKNRYQDCQQVLGDLAAFRTGRKKAAKPAPTAESRGAARAARSNAQAGGFAQAMGQAGVTPRTLAMGGAVGMMFLMCVFAAIWVGMQDDGTGKTGGGGTTTADEPCKKVLEEALVAFRREEFDATARKLDELATAKCGPTGEHAQTGLKRDLQKARALKDAFREALARAKEAEAGAKTSDAITAYTTAGKSFKDLSALIQQPDRQMPDDLQKKLAALEPVRLLEDAKAALRNDEPDQAKHLANLLLDNYPTSEIAREGEEFGKKVVQVKNAHKVFIHQMDLGRDADSSGKYYEAATCYWQAKNAHEEIQRIAGGNKPLPNDLRDRLTAVYPKVWSVRSPAPDSLVENEDLVFEINISEKFFRELTVHKRTMPVKGEFMTLKMSELGAGSHIIEVSAISVDGQKSTRKMAFRFQPPVEKPPKIEIKSISGTSGNYIADIEYNDQPFTGVAIGWKPPDGKFSVVTLTANSISVLTQKKNKFFYQP